MRALLTALAIFALATAAPAQQDKKEYPVHGKIEAVDGANKKLTVNADKIEGFMEAMTMAYKIDKPEMLKKIKVGDEIRATVTPDLTLHNVQVVTPKK
jgi:Cu(I)/Ag(I) efflux system protein CusF